MATARITLTVHTDYRGISPEHLFVLGAAAEEGFKVDGFRVIYTKVEPEEGELLNSVGNFEVGDPVTVAYPAGLVDGFAYGVCFGIPVTDGIVVSVEEDSPDGCVRVEGTDDWGRSLRQWVHHTYLNLR